jgi:cytochrome b
MMQIDLEPGKQPRKPDFYDWIGYVLATAILLPLGWWLKTNYADSIGAFVTGLF